MRYIKLIGNTNSRGMRNLSFHWALYPGDHEVNSLEKQLFKTFTRSPFISTWTRNMISQQLEATVFRKLRLARLQLRLKTSEKNIMGKDSVACFLVICTDFLQDFGPETSGLCSSTSHRLRGVAQCSNHSLNTVILWSTYQTKRGEFSSIWRL